MIEVAHAILAQGFALSFRLPFAPRFWMERAVLDWQGLSFAGFTDGAHVQRTVADWLQLGGGVARKVEQPEPANPPDSAAKSEYSDYTYYTEVKVGEERGHPRRTCFSRPSVEEPHTASSSKWKKNFSAQCVEEPLTSSGPRVRNLPAQPDRQTPPAYPNAVGRHRLRFIRQCGTRPYQV